MATTQLGNTMNAGVPAIGMGDPMSDPESVMAPASVPVAGEKPVRKLNTAELRNLGAKFKALHARYASERQPAEQKWLRNLRQYLGIYDPDIERLLHKDRSRAYPRLTRVKCVSMLSRLMNLMFPGNEENWELKASPSASMSPESVAQAVSELMTILQAEGQEVQLTQDLVDEAVRRLAEKQAGKMTVLLKDQLMELGGDQTVDWITLNRKVVDSGIKYGVGVLEGPYVRVIEESGWALVAPGTDPTTGAPTPGGFQPTTKTIYKPQYDHLPIWDFYPDMSARDLPGEGYFIRKIVGRGKLRKLANREDFFEKQIKQALLNMPNGNYRPKAWEQDLRGMGLGELGGEYGNHQTSGREKYEIIIWRGPISAKTLQECGVDVAEEFLADDVEAEMWLVDDWVIKAEVNVWRNMGLELRQAHTFSFDEDDTSPIGQGLPSIVRDSQLSICAATRMVLDNASVTCGPNLEVNSALMQADQDITSVQPYKIWYRDDEGLTTQFPAVRPIAIDGHIAELQSLVKMFVEFAEMETFIGGATGGDFTKMPSEPMRTAAGASAVRGDAALPFKDIVRNYDSFTQSVLWSLVTFNKKFNPDEAPEGDYDVIPRGATSLIAKEVRGMQIDALSQTMTDDERDHIDERRFVEAKFASRDLEGMLVSSDEAKRRKAAKQAAGAEQSEQQKKMLEATIRDTLSNAFKNIAQAQKNTANADQVSVKSAIAMMEAGAPDDPTQGTPSPANQTAARGS